MHLPLQTQTHPDDIGLFLVLAALPNEPLLRHPVHIGLHLRSLTETPRTAAGLFHPELEPGPATSAGPHLAQEHRLLREALLLHHPTADFGCEFRAWVFQEMGLD